MTHNNKPGSRVTAGISKRDTLGYEAPTCGSILFYVAISSCSVNLRPAINSIIRPIMLPKKYSLSDPARSNPATNRNIKDNTFIILLFWSCRQFRHVGYHL